MSQKVQCPYCKNPVDFTLEHIKAENRLCCMNCNKAFDIGELKTHFRDNDEYESFYDTLENESFNKSSDDEEF